MYGHLLIQVYMTADPYEKCRDGMEKYSFPIAWSDFDIFGLEDGALFSVFADGGTISFLFMRHDLHIFYRPFYELCVCLPKILAWELLRLAFSFSSFLFILDSGCTEKSTML